MIFIIDPLVFFNSFNTCLLILKVPIRSISTTVLNAFVLISSARQRKLPAAQLIN